MLGKLPYHKFSVTYFKKTAITELFYNIQINYMYKPLSKIPLLTDETEFFCKTFVTMLPLNYDVPQNF